MSYKNVFLKAPHLIGVIFITLVFFSVPLMAASFDCNKASSANEKIICNSPNLSNLDDQLSTDYKKTKKNSTNVDELKKEQLAFIKKTRTCDNEDCLTSLYKTRIAELNNTSIKKEELVIVENPVQTQAQVQTEVSKDIKEIPSVEAQQESKLTREKIFAQGKSAFQSGEFDKAIELVRPLAEQGDAEAQLSLGVTYDRGKQEYIEAIKWYKLAVAQGDSIAQQMMGLMYIQGRGVEEDKDEGVKWLKLAADKGLASAQDFLDKMPQSQHKQDKLVNTEKNSTVDAYGNVTTDTDAYEKVVKQQQDAVAQQQEPMYLPFEQKAQDKEKVDSQADYQLIAKKIEQIIEPLVYRSWELQTGIKPGLKCKLLITMRLYNQFEATVIASSGDRRFDLMAISAVQNVRVTEDLVFLFEQLQKIKHITDYQFEILFSPDYTSSLAKLEAAENAQLQHNLEEKEKKQSDGAILILPLFLLLLALIFDLWYRIKVEREGIIIDFDDDTLTFPGGGISANNFSEYFTKKFFFQRYNQFTITFSDIRQIKSEDKRTRIWSKELKRYIENEFHYLHINGAFGAITLPFSDEGKRDELYSIIRQENSMGAPVNVNI
jgi:uncharacterized protein